MVRECRPPARADEVLAGAPLDNSHIDARERQLAGQHQAGRTSAGDHHGMLGHRDAPVGSTPVATGASGTLTRARTSSATDRDNDTRISLLCLLFRKCWRFGGELCDITGGLRQGDMGGVDLRWRGATREAAATLT